MSPDRPIRVALLDPPHGLRDEWYAADPDYADHLAEVVLPALTSLVLTGPVIGLGRQPRRAEHAALQRRHPGSISALALQSGSFFTAALDAQESSYAHFEQICAAVRLIARRPGPVHRQHAAAGAGVDHLRRHRGEPLQQRGDGGGAAPAAPPGHGAASFPTRTP